jgi:hypothetical protein
VFRTENLADVIILIAHGGSVRPTILPAEQRWAAAVES